MEEAKKFDEGKLSYSLLPIEVLKEVTKGLMVGRDKYGSWNWTKGMDWSRAYDAAERHMKSWYQGEDYDVQDGHHHLAAAICNLMFLLYYQLHDVGEDSRPLAQKLLKV